MRSMKFYTYLMGKGCNFGEVSKCFVVAFLTKDGDNEICSEFKVMRAKGFIFFFQCNFMIAWSS